ncbi:MAG: hypothetical protein RLP15_03425 [Cryomorphaceae bacterium]
MNLKKTLILVSSFILVIELLCFILAPAATTKPDAELVNLEYVPYVLTAMTLSFIAFFILLTLLVLLILRADLKNHALALGLLFVGFIFPIVVYLVAF